MNIVVFVTFQNPHYIQQHQTSESILINAYLFASNVVRNRMTSVTVCYFMNISSHKSTWGWKSHLRNLSWPSSLACNPYISEFFFFFCSRIGPKLQLRRTLRYSTHCLEEPPLVKPSRKGRVQVSRGRTDVYILLLVRPPILNA